MNSKSVWIVTISTIIILVVAGALYWKFQSNKYINDKLNETLKDTNIDATIKVPSADPLGETVPNVNPVEKTNPFTNIYKNPFE